MRSCLQGRGKLARRLRARRVKLGTRAALRISRTSWRLRVRDLRTRGQRLDLGSQAKARGSPSLPSLNWYRQTRSGWHLKSPQLTLQSGKSFSKSLWTLWRCHLFAVNTARRNLLSGLKCSCVRDIKLYGGLTSILINPLDWGIVAHFLLSSNSISLLQFVSL